MGGRRHILRRQTGWDDPLAPSELVEDQVAPPSSDDGYPWALQRWDGRERLWRWSSLGMVPLRRRLSDLRDHARILAIRAPVRYVWVRHWTPHRDCRGRRGWFACIDGQKTIGPA